MDGSNKKESIFVLDRRVFPAISYGHEHKNVFKKEKADMQLNIQKCLT